MTEVPARLSIVTLGVRNMGVIRSFYRALGWRELSVGDDAWTGFLPSASSRSLSLGGWSGITLACTVSTREEVDTALAAAVAAGATPVADATDGPVVGRALRIHRRPRGQPLGDHLVTTGHLRPARRPPVLGLSRTSESRCRHTVRFRCPPQRPETAHLTSRAPYGPRTLANLPPASVAVLGRSAACAW
jgi:hypothetical protein